MICLCGKRGTLLVTWSVGRRKFSAVLLLTSDYNSRKGNKIVTFRPFLSILSFEPTDFDYLHVFES